MYYLKRILMGAIVMAVIVGVGVLIAHYPIYAIWTVVVFAVVCVCYLIGDLFFSETSRKTIDPDTWD
jgi:CDP-diglyceride synthetase